MAPTVVGDDFRGKKRTADNFNELEGEQRLTKKLGRLYIGMITVLFQKAKVDFSFYEAKYLFYPKKKKKKQSSSSM